MIVSLLLLASDALRAPSLTKRKTPFKHLPPKPPVPRPRHPKGKTGPSHVMGIMHHKRSVKGVRVAVRTRPRGVSIKLIAPFSGQPWQGQDAPAAGQLVVLERVVPAVQMGIPGQTVYLQIDTGSTDLVVNSAGCSGCPSNVNLYDCSKSKGCSYVDCTSGSVDCQVVNIPDDCWEDSSCPFNDDYVSALIFVTLFLLINITSRRAEEQGQVKKHFNLSGFLLTLFASHRLAVP